VQPACRVVFDLPYCQFQELVEALLQETSGAMRSLDILTMLLPLVPARFSQIG